MLRILRMGLILAGLWVQCQVMALESEFIPKTGWMITSGRPTGLTGWKWSAIPYKAENRYFIVYSDVSQQAVEDIAAHLEVWYQKVAKPLLGPYFNPPPSDNKVRVIFWSYLEAAREFYGFDEVGGYAAGTEARCTDVWHNDEKPPSKGEMANININGLQHEVTHILTHHFVGDCMPQAFGEGIADFMGNLPYQGTLAENLAAFNAAYRGNLNHICQMYHGIAPIKWVPTYDLLAHKNIEWGGTVYQQGASLMHFFFTDKVGRKLWRMLMEKNKTLTPNPEARSAKGIVPLTVQQVKVIEKHWYRFIEDEVCVLFPQLQSIRKLPVDVARRVKRTTGNVLINPEEIGARSPLKVMRDVDGLFKYEKLFDRSRVMVIHPLSQEAPGTLDFSAITTKSKGTLKVLVHDHPNGNVNFRLKVGENVVARQHLCGDDWQRFSVNFDHDAVMVEIIADDWYNEYCFLTYEIH